MNKERIKASKKFYRLHTYYTRGEMKDYLSTVKLNFHLNSYMDLTIDDIVYYVENFKNLREVKKDMLENYDYEYANSWYENLIWVLAQ